MTGEIILIVEDNAIVAFALQRTLIRLGYTVIEPVASGDEAVRAAITQRPDLVLMDVSLSGDMDGVTAAENIQAVTPVPVIYLTGNSHDPRLKQTHCLSKPVAEQELIQMLKQVLRQADG